MKVETSVEVVVACFVLHNLCIATGDNNAPEDHEQPSSGQPIYQEVPVCVYGGSHRAGATAVRDAVINGHFAQRRLASITHVRCCIHHTYIFTVSCK